MQASRKQEIYSEIAMLILINLRAIHTHTMLRVMRAGNFRPELELVHNLHRLLINPEFEDKDIHWLNSLAKFYVLYGQKNRGYYNKICQLISELFILVPDKLKQQLTWEGTEAK